MSNDNSVDEKMSMEKYSLSWNEFGADVQSTFRNLLNDKNFTDVTLVSCDRKQIEAHKVILGSSSSFFQQIFLENPHQHPLLFLKDIRYSDLVSIVNFIYLGQTEVPQVDLNGFMEAAEVLGVRGLLKTAKEIPDLNPFTNSKTLLNNLDAQSISANTIVDYKTLLKGYSSIEEYPEYEEEEKYDTRINISNKNSDGKFACDKCEYSTNRSSHLKTHIKGKHEGVKFMCDKCERQFSVKSNLQAHQHSKHEGKIYSCGECHFETGASAMLSQHKAKYHR